MRLDVSMEELFPAPIERVWQALSQPRMIARWLMPADEFDARHPFRIERTHEASPQR